MKEGAWREVMEDTVLPVSDLKLLLSSRLILAVPIDPPIDPPGDPPGEPGLLILPLAISRSSSATSSAAAAV